MSDENSYKIGGTLMSMSVLKYEYSGFGVNGGYRIYKDKNAPYGMYYGPVASYVSMNGKGKNVDLFTGETKTTEASGMLASFGGVVGRQWLFDEGITLDIHGGLSYFIANIENEDFKLPVEGISPTFGLNIGYSF